MDDLAHRFSPFAAFTSAPTSVQQAGVVIRTRHPVVMLDLRIGRDAAVLTQVEQALAIALPHPRSSGRSADGDIMRLGPDQWLLVGAPGGRWSEDLPLPGATLCDVSHGRVTLRVSGSNVREALSKGCMLDLHPRAFPPGACAQTAIAKIGVILHRLPEGGDVFDLYVARSYAASFWHWITEAALEYGYRLES